MIEVEIKISISNPDEIRIQFEQMHGVYKCSLHHEDVYYNMPIGLRDFRESDEALRIRKSIEFNKNSDNDENIIKYYITYKGPKFDNTTKTRKELESLINEGENVKEILLLLGFKEILTVKKERELYFFKYDDNLIEALIDYIPVLDQHFIEVEYQTDKTNKINATQDLLFDFLDSLGIKRERSIVKSYLELIMEKL